MSWWIEHWPDLKWNVIAEGLGVLTEIVLAYLVIGYLLSRRDEKRWGPARLVVMRQLAKTHAILANASSKVINQYHETGPLTPFETCQMFLAQLRESLSKLQLVVVVSGASLTSQTMAQVAVFIENAESVSRKLQFFGDGLSPNWAMTDVVGQSPIQELEALYGAVDYLKLKFPTAFGKGQTAWPEPSTVGELAKIWSSAPQKSNRLFLNADGYVWKEGIGVFVYDMTTHRALPKPLTDKAQAFLYNNLELSEIQFPA